MLQNNIIPDNESIELVALKRAFLVEGKSTSGIENLDFLFGQKNGMDVRQHTTLGDGNTGQQFVQFLVVPYGQLQMSNVTYINNKIEAVQNISLRTITSSPWFVTNKIIRSSTRTSTIKQSILTNSKNLFHRNSNSTFAHIRNLGQSTQITDPTTISKSTKPRPFLWPSLN
ncbi:Reverse transcriptase domain-containing protein [Aphis craccivora]|uniref:Reverse transcriptase domain-containing protein n=1 Tax=Aphis craccivora TaxID=307492 RepID=A0A6G0Y0R6_APHCR|nr:Reverse transcriptase domain-containing protein [Aphis craccivora]